MFKKPNRPFESFVHFQYCAWFSSRNLLTQSQPRAVWVSEVKTFWPRISAPRQVDPFQPPKMNFRFISSHTIVPASGSLCQTLPYLDRTILCPRVAIQESSASVVHIAKYHSSPLSAFPANLR